jgi:anion-transporting  ArsA/GET3 family ATPase
MAFILTFLGKPGTGRTTVAIAAAHALARRGQRVLFISQGLDLSLAERFPGVTLGNKPQALGSNLEGVHLQAAGLLAEGWAEVKALEKQYLRTPFLEKVFGQELGVLPGMAEALTLYWLKTIQADNRYDALVLDMADSLATLRMLGIPEVGSWYARRFGMVFNQSEFSRILLPLLQPMMVALFSGADWFNFGSSQSFPEVGTLLEQGTAAIADPRKTAAYLVTTPEPEAIRQARWLWGSAQQINLTVGGVISRVAGEIDPTAFAPLPTHTIPVTTGEMEPLIPLLPDFQREAQAAPRPLTIDGANRQVRVFLPGFQKSEVTLTQYGPELTVEAGDQRRNIVLSGALEGAKVTGAKFQDSTLMISL